MTDVVQRIVEALQAFGAGDLQRATAHLADDVVWTMAGARVPTVVGRDAVIAVEAPARALFPDLTLKARRILAFEDLVVLQGVARGTHLGRIGELAPTGRPVGWEYLQWLWVEDGLIRRSRIVGDVAAPRAQIGMLPGLEPPPVPPGVDGAPEVVAVAPAEPPGWLTQAVDEEAAGGHVEDLIVGEAWAAFHVVPDDGPEASHVWQLAGARIVRRERYSGSDG